MGKHQDNFIDFLYDLKKEFKNFKKTKEFNKCQELRKNLILLDDLFTFDEFHNKYIISGSAESIEFRELLNRFYDAKFVSKQLVGELSFYDSICTINRVIEEAITHENPTCYVVPYESRRRNYLYYYLKNNGNSKLTHKDIALYLIVDAEECAEKLINSAKRLQNFCADKTYNCILNGNKSFFKRLFNLK